MYNAQKFPGDATDSLQRHRSRCPFAAQSVQRWENDVLRGGMKVSAVPAVTAPTVGCDGKRGTKAVLHVSVRPHVVFGPQLGAALMPSMLCTCTWI